MPSTTVHLPDDLLSSIDQFIKEQGISRNKFIIRACEEALKSSAGKWPANFFKSSYSKKDHQLLNGAVDEMQSIIITNRKNRFGVDI